MLALPPYAPPPPMTVVIYVDDGATITTAVAYHFWPEAGTFPEATFIVATTGTSSPAPVPAGEPPAPRGASRKPPPLRPEPRPTRRPALPVRARPRPWTQTLRAFGGR